MKRHITKVFIGFFTLFALSIAVSPVNADTTSSVENVSASCPDAQGVKTTLSVDSLSIAAGTKLPVAATFVNNNDFPIVDGVLLVKVVSDNNDNIVARFFPLHDLVLKSKSTTEKTFVWDVPAGLVTGAYHMSAYFVSAKQFAIAGSALSDEPSQSDARIYIKGERTAGIFFDKSKLTLNGIAYGSGPDNDFTATEPITVRMYLANATGANLTVPVKVKVYYWDGISEDTLIDQKVMSVSIDKTKGAYVDYTLTDSHYSAYQIIAEAAERSASSIMTARVSRNINESIVRFIGLTPFPFQNNPEKIAGVKIFGCVYNSITTGDHGKKIDLALTDDKGRVITSFSYPVNPTSVFGFSKIIETPNIDSDTLSLSARVVAGNGKDQSAITVTYDCSKFAPEGCVGSSVFSSVGSNIYNWAMLVGGLVVALCLFEVAKRKKAANTYSV